MWPPCDHPAVSRESGTDDTPPRTVEATSADGTRVTHFAPRLDTYERAYLSSPGLYEAEVSALRDATSVDVYARYYQSTHAPSLRHSERPDVRHIEDEVAHYVMWLEGHPPSSFLSLISPTGPLYPWSCILGFLFGEALSG